ncbi:hypothetical protein ACHAWT_010162 [Skeletonema menzelii]
MTHRIRRRSTELRLSLWRNLCTAIFVPVLLLCQNIASAALFESKKRKLARLHAELARLEEERLESLVVLFGYEFDKLGFYTATSIFLVLFVASIVQLSRSRRKWKRLAIFGGEDSTMSQSTEYRKGWLSSKRNISLLIAASIFSFYVIFNLGRATKPSIGYNKPRKRGPSGGDERFVLVFGTYLDETTFYSLLVTSMVVLVALGYNIGSACRKFQESKRSKQATKLNSFPKEDVIDVIVVDCGLPKKDIGWFHLMQFLDMSNINVRAVVEPFYLDKGKCPQPPQSFLDLITVLEDLGVMCVKSLGQLDPCQRQTLCVLAGRADKSPQYFRECVGLGATHIYLEPPGSTSVRELKTMNNVANVRGVQVYMGYHKPCSPYIEEAIRLSQSIPKSHVFFCHNENYFKQDLHRVLNRHPEGMIRSMASQELAVLVTQFGVTTYSIKAFKVNTNKLFSEKQTFFNKTNGIEVSDFSRVAFKIMTTNGRSVSVMADRCGGMVSFAVVKSIAGKEIKKFLSPDGDSASRIEDELKRDTEMMHQFTIEGEDYMELKRRVVDSILGKEDDSKTSRSVISIQDGIEVLKLSNFCTNEIESALH